VLGAGRDVAMNIVLFVGAILPVVLVIFGAWWFLRAGKRYDERERAAGRRPPG
jgi:hypothetical protein